MSEERDIKFEHTFTKYDEDFLYEFLPWIVEQGASDIIFKTYESIYARIGGVWRAVCDRQISQAEMQFLINLTKGLPDASARVRSGDPDDYAYEVILSRNNILRFRANATAVHSSRGLGLSLTLRTIPQMPPTMDEIKVPEGMRKGFFPEFGLVMVVGTTGSGKSTLLAAVLREIIEKEPKHVLTYEHPIEFDFGFLNKKSLVEQTEIGLHLKTFSIAPPNSLRRAADVVLFGEARDPDTFRYMTTIAETGSAVYTTLHSSSVSSTISRITNVFPASERQIMANAIIGATRMIVYQRLLLKKGGGRIPLQEYLIFTDEIAQRLMSTPLENLTIEIEKIVRENGTSIIDDLERKREFIDDVQFDKIYKTLRS